MYGEDSFYTLSVSGRLSVLALSTGLSVLTGFLAFVLMTGRRGSVRFAIAATAFIVFVWLSPQAYYVLYGLLFDGLPRQWVIGQPPALTQVIGLASFTGPQTLSAHGQGVLFWILTWLSWRRRPVAPAAPDPDR